ncbi:CopG family transcriptional regulator [Hyphomonas sp.]|uniref:CopG family transcriptional regulator n=1 Tax=Hyphomonas sp. TaxID=87 RepID=UPI0025B7C365|nr:CopG family transcriptional regulator [Hyphomonas sp.]
MRLQALAKLPGRSESQIVDQALAAYFSREYEDKRDGALIRRLDRIARQYEGLRRGQIISAEAFALFVRYFLTVIPPVDTAHKEAAKAQGQNRFEGFLDSLRTVLADGDKILFSAVDDILVDESAFFTAEELKRLHEPAPARPRKREAAADG